MVEKLVKYIPTFQACLVIGGSSFKQQARELDKEPDLIIASTGRLLDHMHNTKGFSLENIDILVLDEADKLLEMGFKDELIQIMKTCSNPKR